MTTVQNPYEVLFEKLSSIEALVRSGLGTETRMPTYLKIDKAADFLSTSENALRVMVHKNQIPYIKKHGKLFFLESDLIAWLESGRHEPEEIVPEDILLPNKKRS